MTTAQQQQRDDITKTFEGNNNFYYEPSTDTYNFGYGYNLTSNTGWVTVLKNLGVPASAISAAQSTIASGYTDFTTANNSLSTINASTLQSIKQTLLDDFFTNVVDSVVNYNLPTGYTVANIPNGLRTALEDLSYNCKKVNNVPTFWQSGLDADIATGLQTGDYSSVAYELAFLTAPADGSNPGYAKRTTADGIASLGFNLTLDGSHYVTSVSGSATTVKNLSVIKFMQQGVKNAQFVNGSPQDYAFGALDTYTMKQGYYVPADGDTWNSIAAQVKTNNGITISGYELKRINGMLPGSELTTGKLVYVPTATSTVNTTPALISSIATTAQNPAYVYDGGTVYVVGSQLEDTQNNIKSNAGNIYVPESDGSVTVLHIPGISVSSNNYNNPVFTSPTDIFSFNGPLEVVQTGGVITQLDHIDYLGYQTTKTVVDTDATGADNNQVILTDNENGIVATQVVSATQADGLDTAELKFKGYTLAQSVYSGFTDTANRTYTLTDDTLTVTSGSDSLAIKNFRNGDFGVNVSQYDYVNDNSLKVKLVA